MGSQLCAISEEWKRGILIGQGAYGSVYRALDLKTGQLFVVKEACFSEACETDRRYRDRVAEEVNICSDLRHPHIVGYLGHKVGPGYLHIYLEYLSGGSLASLLNEFGPLQGSLLRLSTQGVLEGLNYLHTHNPPVVHRDIKCANVLVNPSFCVKLADFGCSKREMNTQSFSTIGSIPWMAPEVIQSSDGHGRKADIWSFGCTVIEMATAERPWGNGNFENFMFALMHIGTTDATPPIPTQLPEEGQDLVGRCVRRAPDERPWAWELLGYDFVVNTETENGGSGR
jgi:mitogen-activated protein kinase kinase kinase